MDWHLYIHWKGLSAFQLKDQCLFEALTPTYLEAMLTLLGIWAPHEINYHCLVLISFIFPSCSLGFLYLMIENTPYTPNFVLQMLWSSRLSMCLYFDFSKKQRNLTKVRVNIKLSTKRLPLPILESGRGTGIKTEVLFGPMSPKGPRGMRLLTFLWHCLKLVVL